MNNVYAKDLQKLFIDRGFNPVFGTIYQQQEIWVQWYRGNVDNFHEIEKKNAEGRLISIKKPSLQMAKKVGEDWASLLFNEKVSLTISGNDKAQAVLDNVLKHNNFYDEMPNFIELTAAPYGTGVIVEYQLENETKLNYLFGDRVFVIDYDNTTPKAIAVVQQFQRNKRKYNHIMYHTFKNNIYRVKHEMYSSSDQARGLGSPDTLSVLFEEKELKKMRHTYKDGETEVVEYYKEFETDIPHFQVFKLAISNNYDVKSPLGISCYANAIGTLENIDEKYYSSRMDSINSRKKVFVDEAATKIGKTKDEAGNIRLTKYFDQDETQFQVLKGLSGGGDKKAVEIYAPMYDSAQHDNAIQMELNYLSSKVGLGTNYYSYSDGAVGYQNEMNVIASNSDTFRNRQKNLNRLKTLLINMMKAIMYLEKDNGNYNGELDLEYNVQFDDDIMIDDATVIKQYREDAKDGLITVEAYLMKAYKITEEEAKEITKNTTGVNATKIDAVSRAIESGAISILESKRILNPDMSEEELEIEYIRTLVEKGIALTPAQADKYNSIE
jgi:A118 family predicted phage portal protein